MTTSKYQRKQRRIAEKSVQQNLHHRKIEGLLGNVLFYVEMQRRKDNMEGDSNVVNALTCLREACELLLAEIQKD